MSRMKKYIILMLSCFIALCVFVPTKAKAYLTIDQLKYSGPCEGQTVYTGLGDLEGRSDMYCLQHPSALNYGSYPFLVSKYIEIIKAQ